MPAGVSTYLFEGPDFDHLALSRPSPVLAPSGSGIDRDYAAFGSVLLLPDGSLLGLYHAEQCNRDNYTATVGVARSTDGINWQRLGTAVSGDNLALLCSRITGAGQPSALIVGDSIYLYYVQWGAPQDRIYLARAAVSTPTVWEKVGVVVSRPSLTDVYTALPSVSYNRCWQRYFIVFETDIGFYQATSVDGITWDTAERIFTFPQAQSKRQPGQTWFSYPTLVSPDQDSDQSTSCTGFLYYSKGIWDTQAHAPQRRSFTLDAPTVTPTATPTSTPIPASASTATPTSTRTPTATPTPIPASASTATPTSTRTPTATPTPLPRQAFVPLVWR